ncbi:hypothetical protein OAJ77_00460 [Rhodospirillales bacterium]|nr:hypothetical protein [Rhodospirillales bacterium]
MIRRRATYRRPGGMLPERMLMRNSRRSIICRGRVLKSTCRGIFAGLVMRVA